jgi:uncharacterized damage-inducible protein DinB
MRVMLRKSRWVGAVVFTGALATLPGLSGAVAAATQAARQGEPKITSQTSTSSGGADPVSQAIRQAWQGAKRDIQESAVQMADADYGFKPVDQVRTFGQILAHLAGANYVFCSAARGEPSPFSEDHFEKTATTKASIVKALNESLAYCDAAYERLTDRRAGEMVTMPFGMPQSPRAAALLGNTGHNQEHYGNLVTYFRIKGLVPPSSRR